MKLKEAKTTSSGCGLFFALKAAKPVQKQNAGIPETKRDKQDGGENDRNNINPLGRAEKKMKQQPNTKNDSYCECITHIQRSKIKTWLGIEGRTTGRTVIIHIAELGELAKRIFKHIPFTAARAFTLPHCC
jgi:hypothetical protein